MTDTRLVWFLRNKTITATLTVEEWDQFKAVAYEHKMLPSTYAAHILRNAITQSKQEDTLHEHQ